MAERAGVWYIEYMKKKTPIHKRSVPNKVAAKKVSAKKTTPKERLIGRITHFYDNISVAVIKLTAPLKKGDTIRVEGGEISAKQKVSSMQKDHKPVTVAKAKDEIGMKISKKVRDGYRVYRIG